MSHNTGAGLPPGLLTLGRTAPEPALSGRHRDAVLELLRRAWAQVRGQQGPGREEPTLTTALAAGAQALLCSGQPLRARALVSGVVDDAKTLTLSGTYRRPDLHLVLRTGPPPLLVEAKVLEPGKGIAAYCGSEGMGRFVSGDYGWQRREGVMLAYVRNGSTLGATLVPVLQPQLGQGAPLHLRALGQPTLEGDLDTRHDRPGQPWPGTTQPLGELTLWHLWLAA